MVYFSSSTQALTPPETAESEIAAKRPAAKRGHVERRRAQFGTRLLLLRARTASGEPQPLRRSSTVISGRVRLARSGVDRVFGTGAGCRRAGD